MRVRIGCNFAAQPLWKVLLGVPLIYLPLITTVPFMVIGVFLVRTHLKLVGGRELRSYWDFIPKWGSHRFQNCNQPVYSTGKRWYHLRKYRWFWVFNCKVYCPMSVGLFKYAAYLVEIVENWWCPFAHDRKEQYGEGAIDKSYWHLHKEDLKSLDPADRGNPIWNEDAPDNDNVEFKK